MPVAGACLRGGGKLFYEGEDFEWEDTHMLTVQFPDKKFLTWEVSHSGASRSWASGQVHSFTAMTVLRFRSEGRVGDL